jgi:hypothetical protein
VIDDGDNADVSGLALVLNRSICAFSGKKYYLPVKLVVKKNA